MGILSLQDSVALVTRMAQPHHIFVKKNTRMIRIHYCNDKEEMLRRVKAITKKCGCYYSGFVLPDGRRGFEIHRDGKVEEKYIARR